MMSNIINKSKIALDPCLKEKGKKINNNEARGKGKGERGKARYEDRW